MRSRTRWIISAVTAGGLLATGTAMAGHNAGPPLAHATLAAQVVPGVNLDSCPTLAEGSQGGCVSELQTELNTYNGAGLPVTGTFGPLTQRAVIKFQQENGVVPAQGVFGPSTKAALDQTARRLASHKKDLSGISDNVPARSAGAGQRTSRTPANSPATKRGTAGVIEYPVPKPSESVSQAFYLYYQYDTNVPANCPAKGVQRIAQEGIVPLKPYYVYKTEEVASEDNGFFVVTRTLIDGFSTAVKYLDCRNHNLVYEYYGINQVQREETETDLSNQGGGAPFPISWTDTPWKNSDWL